ncbi:MAG: amidohydrolase family protein [Wenzhouxiangellaceae bacterium]|nr:amidohydrolase family protein [Wenzhouxiangellaceae bacterium]
MTYGPCSPALPRLLSGVTQSTLETPLRHSTPNIGRLVGPILLGLILVALTLLALTPGPVQAAELRQPTPATFAIVDVRIVTAPGQSLESATIVVRDGVIVAVGSDVEPPPDAQVIEFERDDDQPPVTLYPGLIEPYLVFEPEDKGDDDSETPPGRHPLIQPDFAFDTTHWPTEKIEAYRRAGFTTALIAPGKGLFRGQSRLSNLGAGGVAANLLREDVAQHAHLNERAPGGVYPQSLMGSVALFRQTLLDAQWQQRARGAWQRKPSQARPEWRLGVDALAPVLAGDQPLVFQADDVLDSLRILDHVGPDVDLVMVGHGAEYQRLADFDRRPMHILPLDFPDAPDVKDEDDLDVALEDLRHWQRAPENPARMIEAGFPLLLTAHEQSDPAELFAAIATAIEHGLDADAALAALTTGPAEWLGIGDRAGRLAVGYMANLVVVEGELFAEKPSISEVWIDGRRFELASVEPPAVDPAGTWALTLTFGGMGDVDGELTLSGPPSGMEGTLVLMGNEVPLAEARVSGKQLQIKIDAGRFGSSGTTSINLDIDGDRGRGTGSGPFGEFAVRGKKTAGPGEVEVKS